MNEYKPLKLDTQVVPAQETAFVTGGQGGKKKGKESKKYLKEAEWNALSPEAQSKIIEAVISLDRYTDTQKCKRWSDIALQRFYPKMTHLCICYAKKGDFFDPIHGYTLQHDHFLFVYLFFICSTNRRPNIRLFLGYQQIHRC
jgi:hypothetical protein